MTRLAALLILAALPAAAQSPRDRMFPSDGTCYLRQYSAGHLASHHDQWVEQIAIGPDRPMADNRYLYLRVAVYARNTADRFTDRAACEDVEGALHCQIDGSGGWFVLDTGKQGGLEMTLGRTALTLRSPRSFFTFGGRESDDNTFRIPRVPADACP